MVLQSRERCVLRGNQKELLEINNILTEGKNALMASLADDMAEERTSEPDGCPGNFQNLRGRKTLRTRNRISKNYGTITKDMMHM